MAGDSPISARDAETLPVSRSAAVAGPVVPAGTLLADRFRVVRLIARGGMGAVYVAHDVELKIDLALKIVRPDIAGDPDGLARFKREVQLARTVTHPGVCRIFDLWQHRLDGTTVAFMTMELVEGETLAALLRVGPLAAEKALSIVDHVCAGLHAVHAAGVVHRDLKPANVIVAPGGRVVLTDFGIAAQREEGLGPSPSGTPGYMPPEAAAGGPATLAGDLYALGVMMSELVAGDAAPARWTAVAARCRAENPADRPASALEVAAALRPARSRWPLVIGGGALAVGAAIAIVALRPGGEEHAAVPRLAMLPLAPSGGADPTVGTLLDERLAAGLGTQVRPIARADLAHLGSAASGVATASSGAVASVIGDYAIDGARITVELHVIGRDGLTIASVRDAGTDVGALAEGIALRLRGELVLDGLVTVAASTPPPAEARAEFARGSAALANDRPTEARAAFAAALARAPAFALALAELSAADLALGFRTRARSEALQAAAGAGALAPRDRLAIEARLREATDDWKAAAAVYRELASAEPSDLQLALRYATALARSGDVVEARRTLERLPAAAARDPRVDLLLSQHADTSTESEAAARRALARALELRDERVAAWAEMRIADAQMRGGKLAEAEATLASAKRRFTAVDDREGLARVTFQSAGVVWRAGDLARARTLLDEPLVLYRALGHRSGEATVLAGLGVLMSTSNAKEAIRLHGEAIAISREIGDLEGEIGGLLNLGNARYFQGEIAAAVADWRHLQQRALPGTHDLYVAISELNLADVAELEGDLGAAAKRYARAKQMFTKIGEASGIAFTEVGLAWLELAADRVSTAGAQLREVTARASAIGDPRPLALAHLGLAVVAVQDRQPATATRELDEALKAADSDIGAASRCRILAGAAELHALLGRRDDAAAILARLEAEATKDGTLVPRVWAAIARVRHRRIARLTSDPADSAKLATAAADARAAGLVGLALEAELEHAHATVDKDRLSTLQNAARERGLAFRAR